MRALSIGVLLASTLVSCRTPGEVRVLAAPAPSVTAYVVPLDGKAPGEPPLLIGGSGPRSEIRVESRWSEGHLLLTYQVGTDEESWTSVELDFAFEPGPLLDDARVRWFNRAPSIEAELGDVDGTVIVRPLELTEGQRWDGRSPALITFELRGKDLRGRGEKRHALGLACVHGGFEFRP